MPILRLTKLVAVVMLWLPSLPACLTNNSASVMAAAIQKWPQKQACADRNPLRNVYYGDLHVHTSYSFDAHIFDTRHTPGDGYAFAKGGALKLSPMDANNQPTVSYKLSRPLDFAAITDHGEFLGEVASCLDSGSPGYDSETCANYRRQDIGGFTLFGVTLTSRNPRRFVDVCGETGRECAYRAETVWLRIIDAAEAAYDRSSACQFTSLIGYEYTAVPGVSNLHRNVIFRSEVVPPRVISYFEEPTPQGLWRQLKAQCIDGLKGCDVITIPHNSNLANGKMFNIEYASANADDLEILRQEASLRADLEPILEIFQHKGDSECLNGYAGILGDADEACNFEKIHNQDDNEDCDDDYGSGGMIGRGCVSRFSFARGALLKGLQEQEERLGFNPFKLGFIASTDTHNATPGAADEYNYKGHGGNQEDEVNDRLIPAGLGVASGIVRNPGGLAAVWAEENSREAIFDALKRRETFGTSGTRIAVRMFGGWDYPANLCDNAELAKLGYQGGVPMGGDLPQPAGSAPRLVVQALRDPGTVDFAGVPLQRIQIVKGWYKGGKLYEKVYDIAGAPNDATVDTDTCEPIGEGADSLCAVWQDPDFDQSAPAFYYARVLENPSCRWSQWDCLSVSPAERPALCNRPDFIAVIQERAWTSPIWYTPATGGR